MYSLLPITSAVQLSANNCHIITLTEEMDVTEDKYNLPEPKSSQELFSRRAIYVLTELDTDKLSPAYWLTNLMADDSHIEEADDRSD